jgi:hypothetical protein
VAVAALGIVFSAAVVRAEDAAAAPGIDVTGFVDGYYGYNFNSPTSKVNGLRTFDADHNSLTFAVAEVAFEKKPVEGSAAGFRIDLNFGPNADLTNAFEPSSFDSLKHLEQGYVSWLASPKVQLDFGKFVTPIGAEVIESKDNWNYTRSFQFGWAIPFYHAGLRATVTASDKATLALFAVNGWNNVTDNNDDKTFAGQVTFKPMTNATFIVNAMAGKESSDEDGDTRLLVDGIISLSPTEKLSLMANVDYGKEGDNKWLAASGYAKVAASDKVTFSPRVEYVDDQDGFLTGTIQKLMSFTLTTEFKLGGDLLTRIDLRHDTSDEAFFESDTAELKDSQSSVTLGLVYAFGGKL